MVGDYFLWYLIISFPEIRVSLCTVSETAEMFIWIFHCYNRSQPHRLTAILVTYGFSLLCPSGPMHSAHLVFCFTWDMVPVPRNWTSASCRGQFGCQDAGVIIVTFTPMSNSHSVIMLSSHCLFFKSKSLDLWIFLMISSNQLISGSHSAHVIPSF